MVADTLKASGFTNRRRWPLFLPSSSRVLQLVYSVVVVSRYEQLCCWLRDHWHAGAFAWEGDRLIPTGFYPVVWRVHPQMEIHLRRKQVIWLIDCIRAHLNLQLSTGRDCLLVMCNSREDIFSFARSKYSDPTAGVEYGTTSSSAGGACRVVDRSAWSQFPCYTSSADSFDLEDCSAWSDGCADSCHGPDGLSGASGYAPADWNVADSECLLVWRLHPPE